MKKVRVFAPASIANLGCGFDVMGLALDEVGDILEMVSTEGDGITITNKTDVPLPDDIEDNVITPVIRKFFEMTGLSGHIDVTVCQKIYPGSGIGSSAASSAAAAYGRIFLSFISTPLHKAMPGDAIIIHHFGFIGNKNKRTNDI